MPQNLKPENVNNSFFDGYYKDIWRQIFPDKTTKAEVDFIVEEARLSSQSTILDLMCGYGRHALEFARRKINVTAVDNLPDYINEIKEKSVSEELSLQCICTDVLEMQMDQEYDAVICMGNSLQFFDEEDVIRLLSNISEHLKAKGKVFINTWSIAEIAMNSFKEKSWSRIGGLLFLTDSKFLFQPTRIETNSIIITDGGEKEEKKGIDFIYSISELESMFNKTGFQLKEVYSIPGKKRFTVGEPRAYIVAEKK
ncbi:MAG: methyltransferase domain-containing protein [Bacteroidetes bacterium]|nr:MAG: methyltransferase domain-containing protein [Bacteroidota bacterium]